jgi:hypothetical protein
MGTKNPLWDKGYRAQPRTENPCVECSIHSLPMFFFLRLDGSSVAGFQSARLTESRVPNRRASLNFTTLKSSNTGELATRDWGAFAAVKRDGVEARFLDGGAEATLRAAAALWMHMRSVRPDWPTGDLSRTPWCARPVPG